MSGDEPVRYAEWREVPGRSYRLAPFLWRQARKVRWWGWVSPMFAVRIALWLPDRGPWGLVQHWLIVGGYIVFMAAIRRGEVFRFVAPDPLPPDHFPVTVTLSVDGVTYGVQEGLLILHDHWLLFESDECSFSLKRPDVAVVYRRPRRPNGIWPNLSFFGVGPQGTDLHLAGVDLRVSQIPLDCVPLARGVLDDRVLAWALGGIATDVGGEPILPPITPHPFYRRIVPTGLWTGICLPSFVALVVGLSLGKGAGYLLFLTLALPLLVYCAVAAYRRSRPMRKLTALMECADQAALSVRAERDEGRR